MSVSCYRKKTYRTEASANSVVFRLRASGVTEVESYKCPVCQQWHVGRIGNLERIAANS